ncbi:MAG: LysR family transcriptional regulator [Alphaproteobacteria bacterium]|jgi:LysR family glycine cleavage system transcriptional activator|nr:LysR family transcriptional regulator [Alphaproteobacteria bacterium]
MRRLPPFSPLVAFDAVMRHLSFTRAAAELGITQSAVSHRLAQIERHFGTALFHRLNPGLAPTAAGLALAPALREALDRLADLDRHVRRPSAGRSLLRVGVGPALSRWWLVRRLPEFAAAHPEIGLELTTVTSEAAARGVDVWLRWLPRGEARRSSVSRPLFGERVFPVCHPRLVAGGRTLGDLPLLHKGRPEAQGAEWNWATWFDRLGLDRPAAPAPGDLGFDDIDTALSAAAEGAGVALGRSLLVHDALADGRLVRVLPEIFDLASSKVHVAAWRPELIDDAALGRFVAWMVRETARTVAAPETVSPPA